MPDVLGGLLRRRKPAYVGGRYPTRGGPPNIPTDQLWKLLEAPARAMTAGVRERSDRRYGPGLLGDFFHKIDPVNVFGGYGGMLAMALPPGAAARLPKPRMTPKTLPKSGLLGGYPTTTPMRVMNKTKISGGYTVHLPTGSVPEEGLMIGKYANEDPRSLQVQSGLLSSADVEKFVYRNRAQLGKGDVKHLGTWEDPETGLVHFDVSHRFSPFALRQATKFGERTGQKSGWDIGKGESFDIRKWDDFIEGDVFRGRLLQSAEEGAEYLKQFPTKEWWDAYGAYIEDVYGKKNVPAFAGFAASTAPKSQPRRNVQVASEYMRRFIKGEDIIQPEWKAPKNLLGGVTYPGRIGMPMERSHGRFPNLERVARGEMPSGDKVSSQARATLGDPTVGVYDQYYAKMAEDPASGVYTGPQSGVIPRGQGPNRPYMRLDRQVNAVAASQGVDLRKFSSLAWTGIRKRVNETGEAFGQQYGTKGELGESKGLSDHLSDLVAQKAKQLKISTGEMEARLRAGDASLLSFMLATPFLKSLFSDAEGRPPP